MISTMAYGVFIHRTDSIYDDVPSEQYQFPKQYLSRAKKCVGDWIVYYEPTTVARSRGYFAIARVQEIIPDPRVPEMYLAVIESGTYLDFGDPVPFRDGGTVIETGVLNPGGKISGRAQAAVRPLSTADFVAIVERGLGRDDGFLPRFDEWDEAGDPNPPDVPFDHPERERVRQLTSRAVRDRNFRKTVLRAYGETCAVTGWKLLNGGGRAEAVGAHIKPVKDGGPDIVSNGIALSGTVHWMFDRGLIGLGDDLEIKVSSRYNDPETIRGIINPTSRLITPKKTADHPRPEFVAWHREHYFQD